MLRVRVQAVQMYWDVDTCYKPISQLRDIPAPGQVESRQTPPGELPFSTTYTSASDLPRTLTVMTTRSPSAS